MGTRAAAQHHVMSQLGGPAPAVPPEGSRGKHQEPSLVLSSPSWRPAPRPGVATSRAYGPFEPDEVLRRGERLKLHSSVT